MLGFLYFQKYSQYKNRKTNRLFGHQWILDWQHVPKYWRAKYILSILRPKNFHHPFSRFFHLSLDWYIFDHLCQLLTLFWIPAEIRFLARLDLNIWLDVMFFNCIQMKNRPAINETNWNKVNNREIYFHKFSLLSMLRGRGSNPDFQVQSLTCYHYTTPQINANSVPQNESILQFFAISQCSAVQRFS